jgi:hypothetical protein
MRSLILCRSRRRRHKQIVAEPVVAGQSTQPHVALEQALLQLGDPLPQIYAAVVQPGCVSLRLTPPVAEAPHPWQASQGGAVWEAPIPLTGPDGITPYPLLVGVDAPDGEWTVVNLGCAPGLVAVTGRPADANAAALAMLTEIAVNPAAAEIQITIVGPAPTALLALGRVRTAGSVTEALGMSSPADFPDPLDEQFVLVIGPVTAADLQLLNELAAASGNSGAVLVIGDTPAAAWRFGAGPDGALDVDVLGLRLPEPASGKQESSD